MFLFRAANEKTTFADAFAMADQVLYYADANIIVGATFDESLDGIIRVSVVATGTGREVSLSTHPYVSVASFTAFALSPGSAHRCGCRPSLAQPQGL